MDTITFSGWWVHGEQSTVPQALRDEFAAWAVRNSIDALEFTMLDESGQHWYATFPIECRCPDRGASHGLTVNDGRIWIRLRPSPYGLATYRTCVRTPEPAPAHFLQHLRNQP